MMAFSTLSSTRPSIRPFQGQQARPFVQTNLNRKNQFAKRTTPVVRVLDLTSEAQFEAEVLQEHKGALKVVKVEHDQNKGLVEKYKVYGLPTFIVFKEGQEVSGSKSEGAIGKKALAEYIQKYALDAVKV